MYLHNLELDIVVPSPILGRRFAFSGSSNKCAQDDIASLLESINTFDSQCNEDSEDDVISPYEEAMIFAKRRGAICFHTEDTFAKYVRMLGDVVQLHGSCKPVLPALMPPTFCPSIRRQSINQTELQNRLKVVESTYNGDSSQLSVPQEGAITEEEEIRRLQKLAFCQLPSLSAHKKNYVIDPRYFVQDKCLFKFIDHWYFDAFQFERASYGNSLVNICMHLFEKTGLIKLFDLNYLKLYKTFGLIQQMYRLENPYHNSTHAADVTQAVWCFLFQDQIVPHLTKLELMAILLAAACHDLDHPGVNQKFLVASNDYLAETARFYSLENQSSLLEIHHVRLAISIFHETGVFNHIPKEDYKELISLLRDLILATDMSFQKNFIDHLELLNLNDERDLTNRAIRRFLLQIVIKCADICNTCRPWPICRLWSCRVTEEFFRQGDKERKLGRVVQQLNDRFNNTLANVQTGFVKFTAGPLFNELAKFRGTLFVQKLCKQLDDNFRRWVQIKEQLDFSGLLSDGERLILEKNILPPSFSGCKIVEGMALTDPPLSLLSVLSDYKPPTKANDQDYNVDSQELTCSSDTLSIGDSHALSQSEQELMEAVRYRPWDTAELSEADIIKLRQAERRESIARLNSFKKKRPQSNPPLSNLGPVNEPVVPGLENYARLTSPPPYRKSSRHGVECSSSVQQFSRPPPRRTVSSQSEQVTSSSPRTAGMSRNEFFSSLYSPPSNEEKLRLNSDLDSNISSAISQSSHPEQLTHPGIDNVVKSENFIMRKFRFLSPSRKNNSGEGASKPQSSYPMRSFFDSLTRRYKKN